MVNKSASTYIAVRMTICVGIYQDVTNILHIDISFPLTSSQTGDILKHGKEIYHRRPTERRTRPSGGVKRCPVEI